MSMDTVVDRIIYTMINVRVLPEYEGERWDDGHWTVSWVVSQGQQAGTAEWFGRPIYAKACRRYFYGWWCRHYTRFLGFRRFSVAYNRGRLVQAGALTVKITLAVAGCFFCVRQYFVDKSWNMYWNYNSVELECCQTWQHRGILANIGRGTKYNFPCQASPSYTIHRQLVPPFDHLANYRYLQLNNRLIALLLLYSLRITFLFYII